MACGCRCQYHFLINVKLKYIAALLAISITLMSASLGAPSVSPLNMEYKVKAAFMYRFLFFSEWPAFAFSSSKQNLMFCVLGRRPAKHIFRTVEGRLIHGRELEFRWHEIGTPVDKLQRCHALFINSQKNSIIKSVLVSLKSAPVLTIGETKEFIHLGGIINFVRSGDAMQFEVNKDVADDVEIKLRSQMLRIASRIIEDENAK